MTTKAGESRPPYEIRNRPKIPKTSWLFSIRFEILKFIFPHSSYTTLSPPPLKCAQLRLSKFKKVFWCFLYVLVWVYLYRHWIFYWNQAKINQIFIFRENETTLQGFTLPRVPTANFVYKTSKAQRGMFCGQNWSREPVVK